MTAAENLPEPSSIADEFRRLALDLLGHVTIAFFQDHGVVVSAAEPTVETERRVDLPLGATISFVSDHARGTLAVSPAEALSLASHPQAQEADEDALSDWVGEMANQLLGRLKNRLLPYGVELLCDTPMAVSGKARIGGARRPATRLSFAGDLGDLKLWFDVQVDDDMVLKANSGDAAHAEGDLVLF